MEDPSGNEVFMAEAVRLSFETMRGNKGAPFGCVVVKDGRIISRGFNSVLSSNDPTAHAEIVAIREACKVLHSYQLTGCSLYSSCEPCPMCLSAIYWARPDKVYFANTRHDAARIGFDDAFIYSEISQDARHRKIPFLQLEYPDAMKAFLEWEGKHNIKF